MGIWWGTLPTEDGQKRQLLLLDRAGSWAWLGLGLGRWRRFLLWQGVWLQESKTIWPSHSLYYCALSWHCCYKRFLGQQSNPRSKICVNRDTRTFKPAHDLQTSEDQANPGAENQVFEIEASSWEGEKRHQWPKTLAPNVGNMSCLLPDQP